MVCGGGEGTGVCDSAAKPLPCSCGCRAVGRRPQHDRRAPYSRGQCAQVGARAVPDHHDQRVADEPDGCAPLRIYDRRAIVRAGTRRDRQPGGHLSGFLQGACAGNRSRVVELDRSRAPEAPSAAASARAGQGIADAESLRKLDEQEHAATGMGRHTDHAVTEVRIDLEETPAETINIRYKYRRQLVWLGILPGTPLPDPLQRRERARGFEPGFSPEVPRR